MEKESIGLFVSAHPLKEVAAAMALKTDYTLAELPAATDQDRVTVGGIISQTKRIKTKKGDMMMFATLEDLGGSVELVIFGDTLDECADAIQTDAIVLVKGNVDHKDASRTCVLARQIERFEPSEKELAAAEQAVARLPSNVLKLPLDATRLPARAIGELRDLLARYPGASEVVVELHTSRGLRKLKLGPEFRVTRGPVLDSELEALLGAAILGPEAATGAMAGVAAG
jgi:DNA polymerase-3 subunit alpha